MSAFFLALALQITPVQPMPKGTGLPLAVSEEESVAGVMRGFLDAAGRGDAAAIARITRPDGSVAMIAEDGTVTPLDWAGFAAAIRLGSGSQARIGAPAIEIDGAMAMLWVPYTISVGGRASACGYADASLVRDGASWRLRTLGWTSHGCAAN